MKKYTVIALFLILSVSCKKEHLPIERALVAAGENRAELEFVLHHYAQQAADSLKHKAAVFLIENMIYHYTYAGPDVEAYYDALEAVFEKKSGSQQEIQQLINSVAGLSRKELLPDIQSVTSEYLIAHIDKMFETQQYPWVKKMNFSDFCEYILPYRIAHEPLEAWPDFYQQKMARCIDSLCDLPCAPDTLVCSRIIQSLYPTCFYLVSYDYAVNLRPSLLAEMTMGSCRELSHMGCYALRSIGLPAVCDFTPQWAKHRLGHNWSAIRLNDTTYTFQVGDEVPFGQHLSARSIILNPSKVYRQMYSIQQESLAMQNIKEEIPPFFLSPYLKDVSGEYYEGIDIEVPLTVPPPQKRKIAYIMAFGTGKWTPIAWSEIKKDKAVFTGMDTDCLYTVMYYSEKRFFPASDPFYVTETGHMHTLRPDTTKRREVQLKRKYPNFDPGVLLFDMPGGKFQVANKADFSDAVTIHVIDTLPLLVPQKVTLNESIPCRYFRYLSSEKGYVRMAEIDLFDKEGTKLTGDIIGTEGSYRNSGDDKSKVFDGDVLTSFNAPEMSGGWVGLAFREEKQVKEFIYLPRNDDNYIQPGEKYELFYFDEKFVSLGVRIGDESHVLVYKNVPENALLLLRNHTKGIEERIFTYENDEQIWW